MMLIWFHFPLSKICIIARTGLKKLRMGRQRNLDQDAGSRQLFNELSFCECGIEMWNKCSELPIEKYMMLIVVEHTM